MNQLLQTIKSSTTYVNYVHRGSTGIVQILIMYTLWDYHTYIDTNPVSVKTKEQSNQLLCIWCKTEFDKVFQIDRVQLEKTNLRLKFMENVILIWTTLEQN